MSINALTRAKVLYSLPSFLENYTKQRLSDIPEENSFFCIPENIIIAENAKELGIDAPFLDHDDKEHDLSVGLATTAYCYEQKSGISYRRNKDALRDLCRFFMYYDPNTGEESPEKGTPETAEYLRNWLLSVKKNCSRLGVSYKTRESAPFSMPYCIPSFDNSIVPEELASDAFLMGPVTDINITKDVFPRIRYIVEKANNVVKNKKVGKKDKNDLKTLLLRLALEYIQATKAIESRLNKVNKPEIKSGFDNVIYIRFPLEGYKLEYRESIVDLITSKHIFDTIIRVRSNESGGFSYRILFDEKENKSSETSTEAALKAKINNCDNGFNQSLRIFWGIYLSDVKKSIDFVDKYKDVLTVKTDNNTFSMKRKFDEKEGKNFFTAYCKEMGLNTVYRKAVDSNSVENACCYNRKVRYAARMTTLLKIMSDEFYSEGNPEGIENKERPFRTAPWLRISDKYLEQEQDLLREQIKKMKEPERERAGEPERDIN